MSYMSIPKKAGSIALLILTFLVADQAFPRGFARAAGECLSFNMSVQRTDDELKKLLAICEAESAETSKQLKAQQQKSTTISQDVALLDSLIKKARQQIDVKNQIIAQLGKQITGKQQTITSLTSKEGRQKQSLAQILRAQYEIDKKTITEIVLANESVTVSDFLRDAENFASLNSDIHDALNNIRNTRAQTAEEKAKLETQQVEQANLKIQIEADKKKTEAQQSDKKTLLTQSKNEEASYQALLKKRQAVAAQIRAELIKFQGSGVTARSISFGEAYDYAKIASAKTGVRPAFIMAIMQQETGFGNNVGGCNVRQRPTTPDIADGIYIKSGNPSRKTMIPSNFDNFVAITSSLGLDWKTTPVSCALIRADGSLFGFGGAMGYTQFIPNTWMDVASRVKAHLGIAGAASPWNPRDAVMATAVFMQDRGANAQTYDSEYNAACRYYGACSSYAPSVMGKTAAIQKSIDAIESAN
jgi:membrane-bound lytic murein transglycosylase B